MNIRKEGIRRERNLKTGTFRDFPRILLKQSNVKFGEDDTWQDFIRPNQTSKKGYIRVSQKAIGDACPGI